MRRGCGYNKTVTKEVLWANVSTGGEGLVNNVDGRSFDFSQTAQTNVMQHLFSSV